MYSLKNKTFLVTGAGGIGVGHGVCDAIAEAGGRLAINDLDAEKAADAAKRYSNALTVAGDISSPEIVDAIYKKIADEAGPLHGLVNNAGIGLSKPFVKTTVAEFDKLFSVDVRAVWYVSQKFIQQAMAAGIGGSIVNISSCHAHSTINNYVSYAGAKGMVEAFTRAVAVEYGPHNIRCNAVAPGYVHAEQNYELIRALTPDPYGWVENWVNNEQAIPIKIDPIECGRMTAFLLSDFSKAITGQTVRVDAGVTAMMIGREKNKY